LICPYGSTLGEVDNIPTPRDTEALEPLSRSSRERQAPGAPLRREGERAASELRFPRPRIRLGLTTLLALAGCGFHPLYAPSGATNTALSGVYVDIIPNRNGQLLRQALQERMDGPDDDVTKKYELAVTYAVGVEGIGIQADSSSNRTRVIGTAHWTLKQPGLLGAKVISGTARSVDGADVVDAQFFYLSLAGQAIDRRMGDALANQIVQSLATYFRVHPDRA
jgi:LPS-assembly lipoprotein